MLRISLSCRESRRLVELSAGLSAVAWALGAGCAAEPDEAAVDSAALTTTATTYRGWNAWTGACNSSQQMVVYEPATPGPHPVFVYAIGTFASVTTAEGDLAAREMAARGFVAAVVSYNTLTGWDCAAMTAKASCTFSGLRPQSAVSLLCARATADCSRGIVVGGLSQGAALAILGGNADARIRGAWLMGFGGGEAGTETACYLDAATRLPGNRVRVVVGDSENQSRANLNAALGTWCGPFAASCLRANGSGWYRVPDAEVEDHHADHCYFVGAGSDGREVGCTRNIPRFDAGWAPPSAHPWSLSTNLDWLAGLAD